MVPSESEAMALRVIEAGAVKVSSLRGEVMETVDG